MASRGWKWLKELHKRYTNTNVGIFSCIAFIPCSFILRVKDSKTHIFIENITLEKELFDYSTDVLNSFTTDITLY